jgi:hypothetical protein
LARPLGGGGSASEVNGEAGRGPDQVAGFVRRVAGALDERGDAVASARLLDVGEVVDAGLELASCDVEVVADAVEGTQ